MTTLQQVTGFTRKFLAISAMLTIGFLILYFGFRIGFAIKEALYPTPPPPPSVGYGKLPPIAFPTTPPTHITYTLNTVSGTIPTFGDRARVHKIAKVQPNLLALQNATAKVAVDGFTSSPQPVSDSQYAWTNTDNLAKTLTLNIQTYDFAISSNYATDADVLAANNLPDQNQAITLATTFLTNLGAYPSDIDDNKTKVSLFAVANSTLIPATSISTAQIVRVDYFQKDVDKLPIYYSQASYSSMNMFFASSDTSNPQIVLANFTHKKIDSRSETYPIKTPQEAYKDLQNDKGYIASIANGLQQVTIRNITLGYFVSDADQEYLMPVFVFQGDNNFLAYVSAIKDNWLETTSQ